jgi:hypothetical protein
MTVYDIPGKQWFIGFKTKKEEETAKEYLRQLKEKYPEGKEIGTFTDKEAHKRFDMKKVHVWTGDDFDFIGVD